MPIASAVISLVLLTEKCQPHGTNWLDPDSLPDRLLVPSLTCLTRLATGLSHNTLPPAGTPRPHLNVVMRCTAAMSSLQNSIHSPETEINPLEMARGCPCGGVIKPTAENKTKHRAQELCESRGGRPGLPDPVPNKHTVSVDVKQHFNNKLNETKKDMIFVIYIMQLYFTLCNCVCQCTVVYLYQLNPRVFIWRKTNKTNKQTKQTKEKPTKQKKNQQNKQKKTNKTNKRKTNKRKTNKTNKRKTNETQPFLYCRVISGEGHRDPRRWGDGKL